MNLADCYRLLGLRSTASIDEIKASYRRMARQYHPDVNPGNEQAKEKFIQLTEAYKFLLKILDPAEENQSPSQKPPSSAYQSPEIQVKKKTDETAPPLSAEEHQLKWSSYRQLQQLLKSQRFARGVALVEGLAQRFPQDPEVRQWQAIAYQLWGRQLVHEKQLEKARVYLKKALRTDPHNRSLWVEVERDFRRLEQMF